MKPQDVNLMPSRFWKQLTAVPFSRRYYQVANGVINYCWGDALRIVHLVEYPRCGGTWIRHLMQDAMGVQQYATDRIISRDTIIQCHVLPNSSIRRAVVVFRDPRDALVSFYHKKVHYDKRFRGERPLEFGGYRHDPDRPVEDDFFAYLKAQLEAPDHPRFSFGQFTRAWLDKPDTCVIKYEDCKADPVRELDRLVRFVGREVPESALVQAVDKNSFANRTRQRGGTVRREGQSDSSQFERKGIVGDWRNVFNQSACELFVRLEGDTLLRLGYEDDHSWAVEGNALTP